MSDDNYLKKLQIDFFHASMKIPAAMKGFISVHMSKEDQENIDFDTLQFENQTFINEPLKNDATDILYSADFNGRKGYIYIMLVTRYNEKIGRLVQIETLKTKLEIIEYYQQKTKDENLPQIYHFLYYTGKEEYSSSTDFFDLFGEQKELAKYCFFNPLMIHVDEVKKFLDEYNPQN